MSLLRWLTFVLGFMTVTVTSDKAKLFAKIFSKNSNLDDSGISLYQFSLLELI